jgi:hypothetical protein
MYIEKCIWIHMRKNTKVYAICAAEPLLQTGRADEGSSEGVFAFLMGVF